MKQTQLEFTLKGSRKLKAAAVTLDFPLGDSDLKPPDKRPRRQKYLWPFFGMKPRKITDSTIGTLSKFSSRKLRAWQKARAENE